MNETFLINYKMARKFNEHKLKPDYLKCNTSNLAFEIISQINERVKNFSDIVAITPKIIWVLRF